MPTDIESLNLSSKSLLKLISIFLKASSNRQHIKSPSSNIRLLLEFE